MEITKRDIGIDVLKFIAALAITNSHMDEFYYSYSFLATGGAIGDVLFFFCSGFTLFLKPMGRFDNWYKRRINRIYPTIFAWSIITAFIFDSQLNMKNIIIWGGGWFVSCIMIYYILIYLVGKFAINHLKLIFAVYFIICIIWYWSLDRTQDYNMYGETIFKWGHYFIFMLMGAIMGISPKHKCKKFHLIGFIASLICYYVIMFLSGVSVFFNKIQIISLIPLLFLVYFIYILSNSIFVIKCLSIKFINIAIYFIGGLCLEIYIVQRLLLTYSLDIIFPINIVVMFLLIFVSAYILRCFARFFSQTFSNQDFNWKMIFMWR